MSNQVQFLAASVAASLLTTSPQQPADAVQPPKQSTEVRVTISGAPGLPPRYAVPDFICTQCDPALLAASKQMSQVLWDDLNYEREFYMIPRDTSASIRIALSLEDVQLEQWRQLGADALVVGTVLPTEKGMTVQIHLLDVVSGHTAMAREYSGSLSNPRQYAHTIADEVYLQQRRLRGVARTKLVFASDRANESMSGPIENRSVSNIYLSDYDGANEKRVTVSRLPDIAPAWSPDATTIAYTSYRTNFPDILVQSVYDLRPLTKPASGSPEKQNYLPAWSPDGSRLAFMSNRDGNSEIYTVSRDGSDLRRLTTHPAIDVSPTWSPTGDFIAFTSDRTGSPQIWVMNADGSQPQRITNETKCDRPTWSPAPPNEIAYASQTGAGYDIKIIDMATHAVRTLTDGIGSNESPTFAANGRHIAFTSTRAGKAQIFTIDVDGSRLRQITTKGTNRYPNWSR